MADSTIDHYAEIIAFPAAASSPLGRPSRRKGAPWKKEDLAVTTGLVDRDNGHLVCVSHIYDDGGILVTAFSGPPPQKSNGFRADWLPVFDNYRENGELVMTASAVVTSRNLRPAMATDLR